MDLQYYKTFNEDTSQGVVGLLRPLSNHPKNKKILRLNKTLFPVSCLEYFFIEDEPSYPIYVFKISKEVNTLLDHEFKISKDLEELSSYLPHFNKILEIKRDIKCYIPEKNKKLDYNPFLKYNCIRDVSIIEYIPSKLTLLKYVKESNFLGCTESLIHQLILTLFIAQEVKNFTHYDLHLENVLLRKCFKRTFFWYKFLYEGVVIQRLIQTNGYFPVLFDYGFAYSKGIENTNYNNSFFFTNKGYTPFMFDKITDFKTLMIRLTYIRNCPQKFKKFTNDKFLKSNKLKFKLDRETGWIKTTILSASRIVCKRLKKSIINLDPDYKDNFIYKELDNIVELFGILIKIPVNQINYKRKSLDFNVQKFLIEWQKIDIWFRSTATDDKLNIIKKIFETINHFIENEEIDDQIDHKFRLKMFEIFDAFGDFVNIKNLNYIKFLTSIIEISDFIEYIVYTEIQRYKKLFNLSDIMNNWELMTSIEKLVSSSKPYNFQKNDSIVLFDCIEKTTSSFDLIDNDIIETLNISSDLKVQINLLNNLQLSNFSED